MITFSQPKLRLAARNAPCERTNRIVNRLGLGEAVLDVIDVALYVGDLIRFERDTTRATQVGADVNLVPHAEGAEKQEVHVGMLAPPVLMLDDLGDHEEVFVIDGCRRVLTQSPFQVGGRLDLVDDDPQMYEGRHFSGLSLLPKGDHRRFAMYRRTTPREEPHVHALGVQYVLKVRIEFLGPTRRW